MTAQGYNERTDSFVWLCDGPPLLARGMIAAKGTRCNRRLELPRRALAEVATQERVRYDEYVERCRAAEVTPIRFTASEPWQVAQVAAGGEWQMLEALAGDASELAGRVFCPDHRLAWDDEAPGRAIKATLDEQLRGSLEDIVAATYKRLGLPRG